LEVRLCYAANSWCLLRGSPRRRKETEKLFVLVFLCCVITMHNFAISVLVITSCSLITVTLCQHSHSDGHHNHRESLLLSNDYYRQPYVPPVSARHNQRDHHEKDILQQPYEPLRQYENEVYRGRSQPLRSAQIVGRVEEPSDYFRDRNGRPLADGGDDGRSQFVAAAGASGPRHASLRVGDDYAHHGYYDSAPYHTSGNRYYVDNDRLASYRNFELNGGAHSRYTVRTGSEPNAQDGPVVAFYATPTKEKPGKVYVRDIPIYF